MKSAWLIKGYSYCLKTTSPTIADWDFPISYVWVNTNTEVAYILSSVTDSVASWTVRPSDSVINSGTGGQINVIGTSDIGSTIPGGGAWGALPDNLVYSDPGAGEHQITHIKMNVDHKLVATYD
jgi:hypothetical protein